MAQDTGQERTEQPTPKRLREAREKGQIARSRELNTMGVLMAGAGTLLMMGDTMVKDMAAVMSKGLNIERAHVFDPNALLDLLAGRAADALWMLVPMFVLLTVVALLVPMALGGWSFSTKALAFKWERVDPVKGLKRVFALRGLVELLKALAKFAIVGFVMVLFLWLKSDELLALASASISTALGHTAGLLAWAFLAISSALILIALVDVPFQVWDHTRQLRMTRQEVRDELKETDGNPELKAKVRSLQREMAERRMMQEVPKADVVVTNPTHYAVALRYDQRAAGAPRVVALGADLLAARIREVATQNNVTIVSAPPLARALYFSTKLNEEIPAGLYLAVAQVLAYVFQLQARPRRHAPAEITMDDLPIPEDLQHD